MEAPRLLFVYGTLKSDSRHPMARKLRSEGRYAGAGWVRGRRHDLGSYPGLTQRAEDVGDVDGELWEVTPALLAALDAYEGGEFERVATAVRTKQGERRAWCYLYRGPLPGRGAA